MIDIYSKGDGAKLSNCYPHHFNTYGQDIYSMESFLQSLKFEDIEEQDYVLGLTSTDAKKYGAGKPVFPYLYWRGKEYFRYGRKYYWLLHNIYQNCMFQNIEFYTALRETGNEKLKHSIGKKHKYETVLTEKEFIHQLDKLRRLC